MTEMCGDNRFQIIELAKKDLLESTNIDTSPEEMAVLDRILFRCWQMGWLERYDATMHAVQEAVRTTAIGFFSNQSYADRSRLVQNAILGAEWVYINGMDALRDIIKVSEQCCPTPQTELAYKVDGNVSAFKMGAYWAYEIMSNKISKKETEE